MFQKDSPAASVDIRLSPHEDGCLQNRGLKQEVFPSRLAFYQCFGKESS